MQNFLATDPISDGTSGQILQSAHSHSGGEGQLDEYDSYEDDMSDSDHSDQHIPAPPSIESSPNEDDYDEELLPDLAQSKNLESDNSEPMVVQSEPPRDESESDGENEIEKELANALKQSQITDEPIISSDSKSEEISEEKSKPEVEEKQESPAEVTVEKPENSEEPQSIPIELEAKSEEPEVKPEVELPVAETTTDSIEEKLEKNNESPKTDQAPSDT